MFWKVRFDTPEGGTGWLKFDENGLAVSLHKADGELVSEGISYTPIAFDETPEWA